MTAVAVTMMAPPPTPCSARAATSADNDPASPHRIEPAMNDTTAAMKTVLRPNRSPSLPTIAVATVDASR
jgi:hypothetical protein